MKNRRLIVRIIAIVLAALFVGSALTVAITAFAAQDVAEIPSTGRTGIDMKIPIIIAIVAVVIIVLCVVVPRLRKKGDDDDK